MNLSSSQFLRLGTVARQALAIRVDGETLTAFEGDTVMTALLTHRRHVRAFEFGPEKRSGLCLMGACQDCWIHRADGSPVRACTTLCEPGMDLVTGAAL